MNSEEYAEKLQRFNATQKYRAEIDFLLGLFPKKSDFILDYGCGLGTAVNYINTKTINFARGYDIKQYNPDFEYVERVVDKYDVIYFMHSFAHIHYIGQELVRLKANLRDGGVVVVITPNKEWLQSSSNPDYIPDPTVFRHYTQQELHKLFVSCGYEVKQAGQFGIMRDNINERLFIVAS